MLIFTATLLHDSICIDSVYLQVWASGFSAAFLKKQSIATKGTAELKPSRMDVIPIADFGLEPKPAATEAALLAVLEKFFEVVLNLPAVHR